MLAADALTQIHKKTGNLRAVQLSLGAARPGFAQTQAVQHQDVYEIKSSLILQPGPAALTDGLADLERIVEQWANR